ncbi:MAG: GxxExxY protein [Lewinellaceae bacterium]|jgi:GxxExxY protein|nr:GxxExxY protein [Lewinellaceae bacterium]
MTYLHQDLTDRIIQCFFKVYNHLGFGFLEKVYQNALFYEIQRAGMKTEAQKPIKVFYDTLLVGEYYADLVVNDLVILELKAAESIALEHELQLINYLKATDMEIGLLLNFGQKPGIRRKIFSNVR